MVELIVDSSTASRSNTLIHVEIWVEHWIRKPSFQVRCNEWDGVAAQPHSPLLPLVTVQLGLQGRVSIPLRDVIERRKLRNSWALQDAHRGSITMELTWLSALG